MRWQVMVALTNGWLWLLAVLATVVLVVSPSPLWFAVLSGAAVLMGCGRVAPGEGETPARGQQPA